MINRIFNSFVITSLFVLIITACVPSADKKPEQSHPTSEAGVWMADNGDGTYRNPIIHADYSDPDAVRVGGQVSQDVPVRISLANSNKGVNE